MLATPIHDEPGTRFSECRCCGMTGTQRASLVHEPSGGAIEVCLRCIRSSMRMKADLGDERGRSLLHAYAEEYAWQVWKTDHVLYLLPPIAPFAVVTAETAMQSAELATRG